jgi:hypothetical protein
VVVRLARAISESALRTPKQNPESAAISTFKEARVPLWPEDACGRAGWDRDAPAPATAGARPRQETTLPVASVRECDQGCELVPVSWPLQAAGRLSG